MTEEEPTFQIVHNFWKNIARRRYHISKRIERNKLLQLNIFNAYWSGEK